MKRQVLKTILFALPKVLDLTARRFPAYRDRLRERDLVAWIGLADESIGRVVTFKNGRVRSRAGRHPRPDVRMVFKDVATALKFLSPNSDQGEIIPRPRTSRWSLRARTNPWFGYCKPRA